MGSLVQHAAQVSAEGNLLIGQLGILLVVGTARLHDRSLFLVHLQAVRPGIAAVVHQVGQRQKCVDQDFFIVFAGIRNCVVVRDPR